jgi:hypothetical protein
MWPNSSSQELPSDRTVIPSLQSIWLELAEITQNFQQRIKILEQTKNI